MRAGGGRCGAAADGGLARRRGHGVEQRGHLQEVVPRRCAQLQLEWQHAVPLGHRERRAEQLAEE